MYTPTLRCRRYLPWLSLITIAVTCVVVAPSAAETLAGEKADFAPIAPADFTPAQYGLAAQPMVVQPLGVAMYIPDAHVTSDRSPSGQLIVTLHDAATPPAWSVTIQHMHTAPGATPQSQIQEHLDALAAADRQHDIIENRPFTAGHTDGHLCYLRQSTRSNEDESIITGWLILPAGRDVMLVLSILAMPEELPFLRNTLEAGFATLNLRNVAELSLQRRSRVESGRSLLTSFTPDRLRPLLGTNQWSRIYRVDRDGVEREVGYTLLEVYEAKRGELNPERAESSYSPSERTDGIMVRIQGRIIGDIERRMFFDSIAMYWMAWDQSEEAWTVRGTQRQGQAERSEAETGMRTATSVGNPLPTLTVIRQRAADYQRDPYEWSVPDVYLSQALGAVLGRLLPREEERPSNEYAYYFYNFSHEVPQMTQRIDRWEHNDDGTWTLTTNLSVDTPAIVSTYSSSGEFMQTRRPDGTLTVPSTIDRIRQIWLRQGLPISD